MSDSTWVPDTRAQFDTQKIKIINTVLNKIPKLSLAVQKIIEMAGDKNVEARDLVEVVSADPVLTSKILMMVNSSYYGLNRKIDNLRLAIVLLGFNEVRDIAIQTGFMAVMSDTKQSKYYDTKKLWTHSYLVSVCAETFAGEDDPKEAGVYMTMGVLHDIGKFALQSIGVMMDKKGVESKAGKEFDPEIPLLQNEQNAFSVNHNIIGVLLAEKWNLSDRICNVIEYHHYPSFFDLDQYESDFKRDIALLSIADLAVNKIMEEDVHLNEPASVYFDMLDLTPPLDSMITEELVAKINEAQEYAQALS